MNYAGILTLILAESPEGADVILADLRSAEVDANR